MLYRVFPVQTGFSGVIEECLQAAAHVSVVFIPFGKRFLCRFPCLRVCLLIVQCGLQLLFDRQLRLFRPCAFLGVACRHFGQLGKHLALHNVLNAGFFPVRCVPIYGSCQLTPQRILDRRLVSLVRNLLLGSFNGFLHSAISFLSGRVLCVRNGRFHVTFVLIEFSLVFAIRYTVNSGLDALLRLHHGGLRSGKLLRHLQCLRVHGVGLTDPLGKLHLLGKGLLVRLSALVHIAQSQIPLAQYASGQRGVIGVPLLFTGQAGHDLVAAFGLHAVGRNLHSVCVAYALVGKLLLAALISLHKRLQVIIVGVARHVALAGNFGPVKLPLCRAHRVGMIFQRGDRLLHTLVCGGHEFWNVSVFGGGGEQTVAVCQRLVVVVEYGKIGKLRIGLRFAGHSRIQRIAIQNMIRHICARSLHAFGVYRLYAVL